MPPALFTLENDVLRISMIEHGARLISLEYKHGESWRQCLRTLPTGSAYETDTESIGASVGRFANRIAGAQFELNGKVYRLDANHGRHCLHGGSAGFGQKQWQGTTIDSGLQFQLNSPDDDQGFPGNLAVNLVVSLAANELRFRYTATTDADTHVNLTAHPYFDLSGNGKMEEHWLCVSASHYLPVDDDMLPTGEIASVSNTPFDFRHPRQLGPQLALSHPQTGIGKGIDHCLVLDDSDAQCQVRLVFEDLSMELRTGQPGLQVYTANHSSPARTSVCLEPQFFPDAPNQPEFPSALLRAGEGRDTWISYRFAAIS